MMFPQAKTAGIPEKKKNTQKCGCVWGHSEPFKILFGLIILHSRAGVLQHEHKIQLILKPDSG